MGVFLLLLLPLLARNGRRSRHSHTHATPVTCPRQDSLRLHASDPRPIVYTAEELEGARTHDDLWNAAQLQVPAVPDEPLSLSSLPHLSPPPSPAQMTTRGKMHGFLRMYWAKKILECVAPAADYDGGIVY